MTESIPKSANQAICSVNIQNSQQAQVIDLPNGLGKLILSIKYQNPHSESRQQILKNTCIMAGSIAISTLLIFWGLKISNEIFKGPSPLQISSLCKLEQMETEAGAFASFAFKNCTKAEQLIYLNVLKLFLPSNANTNF